ncbi:MAG: YkgJ family cysteine cluster protein [Gemmatimonadota bacterium]
MRYLPLLHEVDQWQRDAAGRNPGVIPCHSGCSACCLGPFDISIADAATLVEGFAQLPEPEREDIQRRAASQLARVAELEPGWTAPYDVSALGEERFDRLTEALHDVPCPVLDHAGRCRLYDHRPLVCRIMGLGMRTPARRVIDNDCPIREDFPAYAALPPQPFDLEEWEDREELALETAAGNAGASGAVGFETIIAAAISTG